MSDLEGGLVDATVTATFRNDTPEEDKKSVTKYIAEYRPEAVCKWTETEDGGVMVKLVDVTTKEMRLFGNKIRDLGKAKRMTYQVFPTDDKTYDIKEGGKLVGVGETKD